MPDQSHLTTLSGYFQYYCVRGVAVKKGVGTFTYLYYDGSCGAEAY